MPRGFRSGYPWRNAPVITRLLGAVAVLLLAAFVVGPATPVPASAASGKSIERDARAALKKLYSSNPSARLLRDKAHGVLVFPSMLKAGFMFGGQIGEGALFQGGKVQGFYNSVAASYGLQAGAQVFGYALFFMNKGGLDALENSEGFELGSGPSLVVLDEGVAKSLTSTTITQDVYAFVFDQKGLMGGLGIQGSKITKISK
jgi:lipid-binding SYLF domain-containing protein